ADKIREDGRKKMEPLMEEKKQLHEKMDAVRKANMEEFEKILTPEQKQKFESIKAAHKNKGPKFKQWKNNRKGSKSEPKD
ncbi:MAG: hypothetical protein MJ210_02820, partial [Alphaproteobacteria bacterium]|nr:hypothetical protein [Alphaproteobacteria bacterium]